MLAKFPVGRFFLTKRDDASSKWHDVANFLPKPGVMCVTAVMLHGESSYTLVMRN